jgi:hypothetical protein
VNSLDLLLGRLHSKKFSLIELPIASCTTVSTISPSRSLRLVSPFPVSEVICRQVRLSSELCGIFPLAWNKCTRVGWELTRTEWNLKMTFELSRIKFASKRRQLKYQLICLVRN